MKPRGSSRKRADKPPTQGAPPETGPGGEPGGEIQAKAALRRSEQKFADIFLNSLDVLLIIDVETGIILTANNALQTILGYSIEKVIGQHFSMLHPPDTEESEPFSVHGAVFPAQKILRSDGSVIPMDLTATLIPWDDRTAVLATYRDASDRENAFQALRESELRYRTLFDQAIDAIILENDAGQIRDANRAACQMTGYSCEELLTMKTTDLRPIDLLIEAASSRSSGEGESHIETVIVRWDGSRVPVEMTVAPMEASGKTLYLSIIRDTTERKAAEEQLRRAHDNLERRVQERTAELKEVNERLLQEIAERARAEERIKKSLGEKEVLLQEIHHRVKNNLQIISSLIALQNRQIDDERTLEALNDSQNRIRSMALIHEQLYHSEDLARVDFAGYLKNLSNTLLRSYTEAAASVSLKVEAEPILLRVGTAIPCGLIVNELLTNCLKHAFEKGTRGEILVGLTKRAGNEYILVVSDNGKGLPPNLDFRRSPSLGLRLVTNLAESQLRARLEIDSTRGTEVRVVFQDQEQAHKRPDKQSYQAE